MVDRVLPKLKLALEGGDYYSAHQMYLTVCRRYVKGKKLDAACELLMSGTKLLVEHQQFGSALDMATVLVKMWMDEEVSVCNENLEQLISMLNLFDGSSREFNELMKIGIQYTAKCGQFQTGEPCLHHHVGVTFYNAGKLDEARRHFMLGTTDSAASLAVMHLVQGAENNAKHDDMCLMVLTPVLQYISSLRIAHALTLFQTFVDGLKERHATLVSKSLTTPATTTNSFTVYKVPVLNFLHLVILTAQRGPSASEGYQALCKQYITQPNQAIQDLLQRVGYEVFEIPAPRQQGNNMLQDLMSSLLGGMQ